MVTDEKIYNAVLTRHFGDMRFSGWDVFPWLLFIVLRIVGEKPFLYPGIQIFFEDDIKTNGCGGFSVDSLGCLIDALT